MPVMNFGDLAEFFVRERTGQYFCCDYYEPGFGYLFTNCGGSDVVIVNAKKDSARATEIRDQGVMLSQKDQNIWNFAELGELVRAKCNNQYLTMDEYML